MRLAVDSKSSHAQADAFFQACQSAFQRAVDRVGELQVRDLDLAGYRVRLELAGSALVEPIATALAHLETKHDTVPDLTIQLFDRASTSVSVSPPPGSADRFAPREELRLAGADGRYAFAFNLTTRVFSGLDRDRSMGIYWVPDAAAIPPHSRSYPLRTLLSWWLLARDRHYVHGGAVETPEGGVLLVGPGGAGKSTTSFLSLVHDELRYIGDDFVLAGATPPTVFSVYQSAKLAVGDLEARFPELRAVVSNERELPEQKAMIWVGRHRPERICRRAPLRAILVPTVTGRRHTTVTPVSGARALRAVAPSTLFVLPGAGDRSLRFLADVIRQVPTARLQLGEDLGGIWPAIRRHLRTLP